MSRRSKRESRVAVPIILSSSSSGIPKWKQSPVDLSKIATWTKKYPPLLLTGYWLNKGAATLTNTGRTVKIELEDQAIPYLQGGPLKQGDEYKFANVQFRWGPSDCRGAEHSVDGSWYSMEAQAMHWNTRYGSMEKCYDKPDGIVMLTCFMQVVGCKGMPDNPIISRITDHLPKIKKMGDTTRTTPDCLWWILETCAAPGYYTYRGSLTVPPYSECVIWIIVPYAIRITARQMNAFRSIYNNRWDNIVSNYRPQQHLHGRRILFATDTAVA